MSDTDPSTIVTGHQQFDAIDRAVGELPSLQEVQCLIQQDETGDKATLMELLASAQLMKHTIGNVISLCGQARGWLFATFSSDYLDRRLNWEGHGEYLEAFFALGKKIERLQESIKTSI